MKKTEHMPAKRLLPIICGPTAAGKTELSLSLAEAFQLEIVSADSRQVYRTMDVGTAKPTRAERARVPHHLIDVVWPDQFFNVSRYLQLAHAAIDDIRERGRRPLLVGGTGLYIRALTEGLLRAPGADHALRRQLTKRAEAEGVEVLHQLLSEVDSVTAAKLHPNDRLRIIRALEVFEQSGRPLSAFQQEHRFSDRPYQTLKIGLAVERDLLYSRINERAERMFEAGLLTETRTLLEAGYSETLKTLQTIGYRQALQVLLGKMTPAEALEGLQRATRRYARQQMTWLRRDRTIKWLDSCTDFDRIHKFIEDYYAN